MKITAIRDIVAYASVGALFRSGALALERWEGESGAQ
jgi:hypothetical protein